MSTTSVRCGLAATFAFFSTALLPAQDVVIRGQIESGQAIGCYYCPSVTQFVIKGSETPVRSSTVSLGLFLSQNVVITGTWNHSLTSPIVDVTTIQLAPQLFTISGGSSIGSTLRFTASGTPGDLAINAAALGAGFTPIGNLSVFLLAPSASVVLGLGAVDGSGTFRSNLPIPSNPALVGLHLFGQALLVPANGNPFYATEPDVKRVQ
jgi:hypothetical protein